MPLAMLTGERGQADSVGGLVGFETLTASTVQNSYATGNVNDGKTESTDLVGGLVGWNDGSGSTVQNSYATGAMLTGETEPMINVGGLVGAKQRLLPCRQLCHRRR